MALEDIMHDVDGAVRSFAASNTARQTSTGLPKPPQIDVEDVTMDAGRMNLQMKNASPQTELPTGPAVLPPPPGPTGACCVGGLCTITTSAACVAFGGTYLGDGTTCSPDPC